MGAHRKRPRRGGRPALAHRPWSGPNLGHLRSSPFPLGDAPPEPWASFPAPEVATALDSKASVQTAAHTPGSEASVYLPISSQVTKPARATVLGQSHRDCLTPYWYLFKTLPGILWTEPFLVLLK